MFHIYLDVEFDAVVFENAFHQLLLSIGAIILNDEGIECGRFYEVIKPYKFKEITKTVKKITHLEDDEIIGARSFQEVMDTFREWMFSYEKDRKNIILYSFGPDDRKTILNNARILNYEVGDLCSPVIDLQRLLSKTITFNGVPIRKTIALKDAMKAYGIQDEVAHNALEDAIDLMKVHRAFLNHKGIDHAYVLDMMKRIKEQEEERKIQARQRLARMMRKRFAKFDEVIKLNASNQSILLELQNLRSRDMNCPFRFTKTAFVFDKRYYSYNCYDLNLSLHLSQSIPIVEISTNINEECKHYCIQLHHANANIIDRLYTIAMAENSNKNL